MLLARKLMNLTFHPFLVRNLTPRAQPGLWQVSEALHLCTPEEGKWAQQYRSCNYFRSMYFDEDGDLAHEFYEEVLPRYKDVRVAAIGQLLSHHIFRRKGGKRKMRRIEKNLRCVTNDHVFNT